MRIKDVDDINDSRYRLSSDDVIGFGFVEPGDSFDGEVVAFGGTASEDYVFRIRFDQIGDLLQKKFR